MVRSFFGQGTPSRSRAHEPVIGSESFGNQEGNSSYDRGDVGKPADSNWFELARHPTSELGRKPHRLTVASLRSALASRGKNNCRLDAFCNVSTYSISTKALKLLSAS